MIDMTQPAMDNAQLSKAIADAALLRGDFTLRSGRKSKYYLDKYLFETQPAILREIGLRIGTIVNDLGGADAVDRLAGAELGGIPLVTAASLATGLPSVLIRNQKKGYGTSKQLEGKLDQGDRIIFIEDVITSGGQTIEAAKTLRDVGANLVAVIVVLDRQEGARQRIEQEAGCPVHALFTKTDLGIGDD